MRALLAAACISAISVANGQAAPAGSNESARRFLDMVNRPVVLAPPASERVNVLENRAYRHDVPQALADVYLPTKPRAPAPIVILVHGGVSADVPIRPKDWGSYRSWGRWLATSGFVAVNHRLAFPEPMIEEAAGDLDSLVAFVRASARGWGADPDRIAIATYSAGGMLLASALRDSVSWLRSVVAFYPIVGLTVSTHLRTQLTPEQLERHSLGPQLSRIARRMPPLLLIRAGRDQIPDLLTGVDRFLGQAMSANAPVIVVNHPDAGHGFDNQEPTARTRAVLELALAFLKETLSPNDRL